MEGGVSSCSKRMFLVLQRYCMHMDPDELDKAKHENDPLLRASQRAEVEGRSTTLVSRALFEAK